MYQKVIDHKDLVRDANSKAILNQDSSSLNKYREEREYKQRLANVVNEHQQLKNDVAEIKNMLKEILGKASK
jgi:DNA-binding transcriptional regulator YhcF (GntR family)